MFERRITTDSFPHPDPLFCPDIYEQTEYISILSTFNAQGNTQEVGISIFELLAP
jgi:hypothetical protein